MELCQVKTIKQGKLIFWKGSQKHLLPKGFFGFRLQSPEHGEEALQVITEAKWPVGVPEVYHCVSYGAHFQMCCFGVKAQVTITYRDATCPRKHTHAQHQR